MLEGLKILPAGGTQTGENGIYSQINKFFEDYPDLLASNKVTQMDEIVSVRDPSGDQPIYNQPGGFAELIKDNLPYFFGNDCSKIESHFFDYGNSGQNGDYQLAIAAHNDFVVSSFSESTQTKEKILEKISTAESKALIKRDYKSLAIMNALRKRIQASESLQDKKDMIFGGVGPDAENVHIAYCGEGEGMNKKTALVSIDK